MDLSKEVAKEFNLEDKISSNGHAVVETPVKEAPKQKVLTPEELKANLQGALEMMDEMEEAAREQGFASDSIILVLEETVKLITVRVEELKAGKIGKKVERAEAPIPSLSNGAEKKGEQEKKDPLEYMYDFEKYPPLTCKFIGPGPDVMAEGRKLKTWAVEATDPEKTQWLIPQWSIFSEVQGNFLGFQGEEAGKYIYQLTYKGVQQLPGNAIKFMVEILKKFPG